MDVNSYIGFDVTYPYNKIMLRVNRRGPTIASKEITKNFAELSPKKIFSLVKSSGQNLALSVLDNSSDLIYVKATSIQEDYTVLLSTNIMCLKNSINCGDVLRAA